MAIRRISESQLRPWAESRTSLHREIFSSLEMEHIRRQAAQLWDALPERRPSNVRFGLRGSLDDEWILDRIDPLADVSPFFRDLAMDRRLTSIAQECLGGDVILMKEKLIFKPPGAPGYGAHRDGAYFCDAGPGEHEMLTVALALDRASEENGALKLYPESRRKQLASPPGEARDIAESALISEAVFQPELEPGDAVFFDCSVPHNSAPNRSDQARRGYFITYALAKYHSARSRFYDRYFRELAAMRRNGPDKEPCFVIDAKGRKQVIDPDKRLAWHDCVSDAGPGEWRSVSSAD
ncbi:MAG: hypothetical protein HKN15_13420 [Xanthomonadales bacterium]|nr:hypothetical protein [Xanthomonadales bacterium]